MYVGASDIKPSAFPLTRTDWLRRSSLRYRKCSYSGKTIWPWQRAYCQDTAYGEANSEPSTWDIQTEWLTPEAYTYKILKDSSDD